MPAGEKLKATWETLEGEHLKTAAELAVHGLGLICDLRFGNHIADFVRGGERIEDPRLHVEVAGLHFENPVMVGAGWDKKGRAVDGLYALNFAGTEVGSVPVYPQFGLPRPRLFIDKSRSVGRNCLGFNSPGEEVVDANLEKQRRLGIVGISLCKNKLTPDEYAPWAHAAVAERLYDYADYFAINVASPNTPGLRNLLNPKPLTEIIKAVQAVLKAKGDKPLFVKTTVDLAIEDLDAVLEVLINEGVSGIIDTNTTIDEDIKRKYGWAGEMGGVSGNDEAYRLKATRRMRHITRQTAGTGLARIGVGGINDAASALERIEAGAQVVQLVTAIRQHKGRVAHDINAGILHYLEKTGAKSVSDIIGIAA